MAILFSLCFIRYIESDLSHFTSKSSWISNNNNYRCILQLRNVLRLLIYLLFDVLIYLIISFQTRFYFSQMADTSTLTIGRPRMPIYAPHVGCAKSRFSRHLVKKICKMKLNLLKLCYNNEEISYLNHNHQYFKQY